MKVARSSAGRLLAILSLLGCLNLLMLQPAQATDPRIELLEAVKHDDANAVRNLLTRRVSPNVREKEAGPAIVLAVKSQSWAALHLLADAEGIEIDAPDSKDQTALMLAAIQGQRSAVEKLILQGASVNRPGWTPLHYAAVKGDIDIIRLLLRHGAKLDARSANGTTAIMMAARHKSFSAMELLADAGADLDHRNDAGLTVLGYLQRHEESAQIDAMKARILRRAR